MAPFIPLKREIVLTIRFVVRKSPISRERDDALEDVFRSMKGDLLARQ